MQQALKYDVLLQLETQQKWAKVTFSILRKSLKFQESSTWLNLIFICDEVCSACIYPCKSEPSVLSCTSNLGGCHLILLFIRIPGQEKKLEVHSLVWNKWWANHCQNPPGSFWAETFASGCFSVFLDSVWTADKDKIIEHRCKVIERQNWRNQWMSGKSLMGLEEDGQNRQFDSWDWISHVFDCYMTQPQTSFIST